MRTDNEEKTRRQLHTGANFKQHQPQFNPHNNNNNYKFALNAKIANSR